MYEKVKRLKLNTVSANVPDLDAVLGELYTKIGLKAFLRFDLDLPQGITPVALLKVGEHTLELLGRVVGERSVSGVIQCVEIEADVNDEITFEPAPGMMIRCRSGKTPGIHTAEILTTRPKEDAALFIDYAGAFMNGPGRPVTMEGGTIRFVTAEGSPSEQPPGLFFPGWHRLGFHVSSVTDTYDMMAASGSSLSGLVEPFQVMPGLKEAMLLFPSGIIIQIIEESFVKMTPSLTLEWVRSKILGHQMRFKTTSPM